MNIGSARRVLRRAFAPPSPPQLDLDDWEWVDLDTDECPCGHPTVRSLPYYPWCDDDELLQDVTCTGCGDRWTVWATS